MVIYIKLVMSVLKFNISGLILKYFHLLVVILSLLISTDSYSQSYHKISMDPSSTHQTIRGFGGSLAYYENWLTAHPKKSEIYDALFNELSLDILRLRNAHDYDPGMVERATEFVQAAESSSGRPIKVLSTSWGPPGWLKNNNDRKNGGSLRYTTNNGAVEFDYHGFAGWWYSSLDEYNANGIYPDFISIQNEPDYTATWESCRLDPTETINSSDTIAGYNKALDAVYDTIQNRTEVPKILAPETIGIGYNAVEKYCNAMDLSKIHAIAHHLYHGVDEDNPYASTNFKKLGDFHPEIPHFQTEYSRGDWWSLAGLLYMSLCKENAAAYLYWDLAWDGGGLVSLDFPWDRNRWADPDKGYTRTKNFYVFKQYSAFIQPGWQRVSASLTDGNSVVSAFISPYKDSAAAVVINRSETEDLFCTMDIPGYNIHRADLYITSENASCRYEGDQKNKVFSISPRTIASISMDITVSNEEVQVESIILSLPSDSITTRKDSLQIEAEVYPEDAGNQAVFWEVIQEKSIAGINQEGLLISSGSSDGEIIVRASATDGSGVFVDTIITVINQVQVDSISLTPLSGVIDEPQGYIQFTAEALPADAYNRELLWELVKGNELAELDQNGFLQANGTADGEVIIKVSAKDGSGSYAEAAVEIRGQIPVTDIQLTATDTVIDELQGSLQIEADVLPENASDTSLLWSIEEGINLAFINETGLITATGEGDGKVRIRATSRAESSIYEEIGITIINQSNSISLSGQEVQELWTRHGILHYKLPPSKNSRKLSIYNMQGKKIKTVQISAGVHREDIDVSDLHNGIYLLVVEGSGEVLRARVGVYSN